MFPRWNWRILTLPPRHFSWRVRGNPLYWALASRDVLEESYDLLIATSMVDLATLRGLVPALASLPSILYFHENQFEYPLAFTSNRGVAGQQQRNLLEAQMVSLYSALAADRIVFNSGFNLQSFFRGAQQLLERLPDAVPPGLVSLLQGKSSVLAVPLANAGSGSGTGCWPGRAKTRSRRSLRLLWVGRFEYDKGGDRLLAILGQLEQAGLDFQLAVVGQQFRRAPDAFARIERDYARQLVQFGYIESRADYLQTLAEADMVLSTALHEFQGLAVLEAIAAGCVPVLPARLVYPELVPREYCYPSCPGDVAREAEGAAELIVALAGQLAVGRRPGADVSCFSQDTLRPGYEALISELCPGVIADR